MEAGDRRPLYGQGGGEQAGGRRGSAGARPTLLARADEVIE
jgi:hypothetical protein